MWIDYLGEIAMLFFVLLIALHLGVHFWFKWQKKRKQRDNHD
ncbi:hypothetical protein [Thiomicrorhabdus sediminis]|nr:hypothetical protein [Thiomicrorhabdus sediminis]